MFIEVSVNREKVIIDTNHILLFKVSAFGDDMTTITFDCPLGMSGTNKMVIDESYEELKKRLM